jgi:hypothetical protein
MKTPYEIVAAAWEAARRSATSKEDFQEKWSSLLERHGWTREEFHEELDRQNMNHMGM